MMTEGKTGGTELNIQLFAMCEGYFLIPILLCILYRHSKKTTNVPHISLFPEMIRRYDLLFWSIHRRLVREKNPKNLICLADYTSVEYEQSEQPSPKQSKRTSGAAL